MPIERIKYLSLLENFAKASNKGLPLVYSHHNDRYFCEDGAKVDGSALSPRQYEAVMKYLEGKVDKGGYIDLSTDLDFANPAQPEPLAGTPLAELLDIPVFRDNGDKRDLLLQNLGILHHSSRATAWDFSDHLTEKYAPLGGGIDDPADFNGLKINTDAVDSAKAMAKGANAIYSLIGGRKKTLASLDNLNIETAKNKQVVGTPAYNLLEALQEFKAGGGPLNPFNAGGNFDAGGAGAAAGVALAILRNNAAKLALDAIGVGAHPKLKAAAVASAVANVMQMASSYAQGDAGEAGELDNGSRRGIARQVKIALTAQGLDHEVDGNPDGILGDRGFYRLAGKQIDDLTCASLFQLRAGYDQTIGFTKGQVLDAVNNVGRWGVEIPNFDDNPATGANNGNTPEAARTRRLALLQQYAIQNGGIDNFLGYNYAGTKQETVNQLNFLAKGKSITNVFNPADDRGGHDIVAGLNAKITANKESFGLAMVSTSETLIGNLQKVLQGSTLKYNTEVAEYTLDFLKDKTKRSSLLVGGANKTTLFPGQGIKISEDDKRSLFNAAKKIAAILDAIEQGKKPIVKGGNSYALTPKDKEAVGQIFGEVVDIAIENNEKRARALENLKKDYRKAKEEELKLENAKLDEENEKHKKSQEEISTRKKKNKEGRLGKVLGQPMASILNSFGRSIVATAGVFVVFCFILAIIAAAGPFSIPALGAGAALAATIIASVCAAGTVAYLAKTVNRDIFTSSKDKIEDIKTQIDQNTIKKNKNVTELVKLENREITPEEIVNIEKNLKDSHDLTKVTTNAESMFLGKFGQREIEMSNTYTKRKLVGGYRTDRATAIQEKTNVAGITIVPKDQQEVELQDFAKSVMTR